MNWRRWQQAVWPPLPVWQNLDAGVAVVAAYAVGVCAVNHFVHAVNAPDWGAAAAGLNALILGLLLAFRNMQAYDRWWEGRKLWGQLVNDSRNFALKAKALPGLADADRAALRGLLADFPRELRGHLRGPGPQHDPMAIAGRVYALLRVWRTAGKATEFDLLLLDPHARALMDVCGACERIRNTPLPLSYRSLLRHGLVLLLLATPWFIVEKSGWWSVPAMALLGYFLLGIELTAASIENPFEEDHDDLPLDAFCRTIRRSVEDALGPPEA